MKEHPSEKICKQYGDLISAYFDGQLTDAQMTEVENHLRDCPLCTRQLEQYRLIRNLINLEKQHSPVDLNATVMAGMEREQLLSGLDELAKPPTAPWTKILRTAAVAAMVGLVVYAGFLVVQFAGNNTRPPTLRQPPKRTFAENTSTKYDYQKKNEEPFILGTDNSFPTKPVVDAPAAKSLTVQKKFFAGTAPSVPSRMEQRAAGVPLSQPLVLRPSRSDGVELNRPEELADPCGYYEEIESLLPTMKGKSSRQSLAARIPSALKYRLWAPDQPSWMLLKEQVLEILKKNHIPSAFDAEQIASDLNEGKEFFYQARKGLDLAPGTACSGILVVADPDHFRNIHAHLQQYVLETIRQDIPPELKKVLTTQPVTTQLAGLGSRTVRDLDHYFSRKEAETDRLNQPTATTTATASAPAAGRKILLPVLITLEIPPHLPPTTTAATSTTSTSAPATQTTQTSQPASAPSRPATQP